MKPVIIFSLFIVSVLFFTPLIVDDAFAQYVDQYDFYQDDFGIFSMNYPADWYVLHEGEGSVIFQDGRNSWENMIQVFYYEDIFYNELTTSEIKKDIELAEEDFCYSLTFEFDGVICYNFQFHDSKKIKSNPATFKSSISYVKEHEGDSTSYYINVISINVIDKENVWTIVSESIVNGLSSSKIKQNPYIISKAMESFNLKQSTSEYSSLSNLPTLEYYYYVEDLPDWEDSNFYKSAVKKAIQKISQENPWLTFREVAYEDSEIDISWIKEYGTGTLGEAHSTIGSVHIEMGDSLCGYWLPHSEEMLADTVAHELLHGVGFEHVNNPKSIMYYQASDAVYDYEEYGTYQFEEYAYQFIPLCTSKNTTDYLIEVSSDEYNEKFDVFFVKSERDAEKYGNGDYFDKYQSCYEENTNHFSNTCRNVSSSGGIVIGTDYISDGMVNIDVFISETRYNQPTDYSLEKVVGLEYVLGVNANFEADRQNYNKAISIYNKILESNPNDTFALNNLGTVYDDLGDSTKALQYYEKTLRLNPLDEFALSNIGTVLQEQGKYKEAIEYYEKALDVNPQSTFTLQMEREVKILLEAEQQVQQEKIAQLEAEQQNKIAQLEAEQQNKIAQLEAEQQSQQEKIAQLEAEQKGGGCLIATATYGSEMASEVQQLREIRDNTLLNTESGTNFMNLFNDVYYSFSPIIADYERENPIFKEMVKVAITPMISSLLILNYVDMDSESEVLGYGISLIILNLAMYLGVPAVVIIGIRKKF